MRFKPVLLYLALTILVPLSVHADSGIFGFVDEEGVEHLSNIPDDKRYRLVLADRFEPARAALHQPRGILALPYGQRPFHDSIMLASRESGVDAKLLHAVITVESGYNQSAVSSKGATGLMQLLPSTASRYGAVNLLDPTENVRVGARYLRDLLALFGNDLELALAAYNAGENAVIRHGRRLPPYAETRRYVPLVFAYYRQLSSH